MDRLGWRLAALGVVAATLLAVASGHRVFSQTYDEPTHLAVGLEWWQLGSHTLQQENPPLATVAVGALPFASGLRIPERGPAESRGLDVLYGGGDPTRVIALARRGVLPFLALAAGVVWVWAERLRGPLAATLAVLLLCTVSPFVGHAGLATTDVPFAALLLLALFVWGRWIERPSLGRAAALGAAMGAACATKFTALVFVPVGFVALAAALAWAGGRRAERSREGTPRTRWLAGAALAIAVASVVVWASYRFSVGAPSQFAVVERLLVRCTKGAPEPVQSLASSVTEATLPAPELWSGLLWACAHYRGGHPAYLLGATESRGFASFYPVALSVKSPIPFLVLAIGGVGYGFWVSRRRRSGAWAAPGAVAVALLAVAIASDVDVGLRHVLVLYPLLAIPAAVVAADLWESSRWPRAGRIVVVAYCAWQVAGFAFAHPDHFSRFNALAPDPGAVLVDSDLDWGQDLARLEAFFRERDVDALHIAYWGVARLCAHDLPELRWLPPRAPVAGWVAISESYYRGRSRRMFRDPCVRASAYPVWNQGAGYAWLADHEPVAWVGDSIRIYRIPGD